MTGNKAQSTILSFKRMLTGTGTLKILFYMGLLPHSTASVLLIGARLTHNVLHTTSAPTRSTYPRMLYFTANMASQ